MDPGPSPPIHSLSATLYACQLLPSLDVNRKNRCYRKTVPQTGRHIDTETQRQTGRNKGRQADKHTHRLTHTDTQV